MDNTLLKIAIIDDREEDRERLKHAVAAYLSSPKFAKIIRVEIDTFDSAEAFLTAFEPGKYQIAFLDIIMHEMNGIELAVKLRASDARLLIVFQTTSREHAFDAFPVHPFDYLIKPWEESSLWHILAEALRVINAADPEISVSQARGSLSVPLRNIIAATSSGHNTELILINNQTLMTSEPFKSIRAKLEEDKRFLEINRGIIVNMDCVLKPSAGDMLMNDGRAFPIRANGRSQVLSTFAQYTISRIDRRDFR